MRDVSVWRSVGLAGVAALAGCSGGSSGNGSDAPPTYDEMVRLGAELDQAIGGELYAEPASLPDRATATYEGVVALNRTEDAGSGQDWMVGEFALDVDFAAGGASGQAGNFRTAQNGAWNGALRITDVDIFRDAVVEDEYTYAGLIGGTLSRGEDELEIGAELLGDFYGESRTYTDGVVVGDATLGDGSMTRISGEFLAAER